MAGSPLLALLAGLANVPGQMQQQRNAQQDRAMKVQMEQSAMKQQAAQADLAKANAEGEQIDTQGKFYQQIAQLGKNNPKLYSDPNSVAGILSRAKAMNIDTSAITTTDDKGNTVINPAALNPQATLADMTDDERMKLIAMDTPHRIAFMKTKYSDFDQQAKDPKWQEFINAAPYSPVTGPERVQLEKLPTQWAADMATGKMTPTGYKGAVNAVYPRMKAAGLNPDYLLSDENLNQQASKLTQAQIQKDLEAGLHWKNMDATAKARLEQLKTEFGVKEADRRYEFNERDLLARQRMATAMNNLSYRAQSLRIAEQRLDMAQQDQAVRITGAQQAVLDRAYKALNDQYNSVHGELERMQMQAVNLNAQNNGKWRPDDVTVSRMKTLNDQLYVINAKLTKARNAVVQAPAAALTAITGKKSEVIPSGDGSDVDISKATDVRYNPKTKQHAYLIDNHWVIK